MHNSNGKQKTDTVTCSCVTGERSLRFTQRNLGNFRGFYSQNSKSHKKSIQVGTPLALPLIDGRLR